jgi:hypothetical protein
MSKEQLEWGKVILLLVVTVTIGVFANKLNSRSFWDVSKNIYAVKSEVGNFRSGPSLNDRVIRKLKYGDSLKLTHRRGEWYKGRHQFMDGWVHKSIVGRFLRIGYYNKYEIGKSVFEVVWN